MLGLKPFAKTFWYLLIKDKGSYPTTRYIPVTAFSLLVLLWSYPLQNMVPTGELCPTEMWQIRLGISIIIVFVGLVAFFIHAKIRFKKFTKTHELSSAELNSYLDYMNK